MQDAPALLVQQEVADLLRVEPRTVRRWAREGKIPAVKLPSGEYRFRREDVDDLIESGSAA
jgi:excisionase family DNA binding protein